MFTKQKFCATGTLSYFTVLCLIYFGEQLVDILLESLSQSHFCDRDSAIL